MKQILQKQKYKRQLDGDEDAELNTDHYVFRIKVEHYNYNLRQEEKQDREIRQPKKS